jgi:hypothetical protein
MTVGRPGHADSGSETRWSIQGRSAEQRAGRHCGERDQRLHGKPGVPRLWVTANQFAHSQLISVLNGDSTMVTATGGQVVLNLIPLVNVVLHSVSWRLSAAADGAITLPSVSTISAACHAFTQVSHQPRAARSRSSPATAMAGLRYVLCVRALTAATWLVPILTPLALVSALAVARRRAGAAPCFRPLADGVTELDHFLIQRRDRAGGAINEYRLVA